MTANNKCVLIPNKSFISIIYARPEIWDYSSPNYMKRQLKAQAWEKIAEELDVNVNDAKIRWGNLRDFFRKLMKKKVMRATETGDPDAYVPDWKNFKDMFFLQEQVLRSLSCDSQILCQKEHLYDVTNDDDENDADSEEDNSDCSLASTLPDTEILKSKTVIKQEADTSQYISPSSCKKQRTGNDVGDLEAMDADYHFLMSILPSIRNIRRDRKILFRMKVLKLIMEEEEEYAK